MTRSKKLHFPSSGLKFLKSLKRNNRRDWFLAHKEDYESSVRQPMIELVNALSLEFAIFAPEFVVTPKASLFRIYRDTRFSKDKTPYKTHAAASFYVRGMEKHEAAGLYLHIAPNEFLIGGGLYSPQPEDLAAVRDHISVHHKKLHSLVTTSKFRKMFGELSGAQLVRVPRGFRPDHAAADYLRRKQFLATRLFPSDVVLAPQFGSVILETFRTLLPLIRFLNEPIARNKASKQRRNALLH